MSANRRKLLRAGWLISAQVDRGCITNVYWWLPKELTAKYGHRPVQQRTAMQILKTLTPSGGAASPGPPK